MNSAVLVCCLMVLSSGIGGIQAHLPCPKRGCLHECDSGYELDSRGCETCDCLDPCKVKHCPRGQICKVKYQRCGLDSCPPIAVCVPIDCPPITCPDPCESGYREDFHGCQTCRCVNPCEYHKCKDYEVCISKKVFCITAPCYPIAVCKVCKVFKCRPCESGYRVDDDGCPSCKCVDPCEYPECSEGEVCKTQNVVCKKAPCYPVFECVKGCPPIKCAANCDSGFREDYNGCRTCECIDPCERSPCGKEEICVKRDIVCVKAPCYPEHDCIGVSGPDDLYSECPQVKCSVECVSGFRKDENGCQTCQCVDPCEHPDCVRGEVCVPLIEQCEKEPCYQGHQCVKDCPQVMCLVPCTSGYREDYKGCQTCDCVDPCEYSKCEKGEVCKRKDVVCIKEPCYDEYECVKEMPAHEECQDLKCDNPCQSGYREDGYGCHTCQCVDPCEYTKCGDYEVCKKKEVQCVKAPCYPVHECVEDVGCPEVLCAERCVSGYRVDHRGCSTCECVDPCEYPKCPPGEVCFSQEVQCFAPPCYPVQECRKVVCPQVRCIPCARGYKYDDNGCQTCECLMPKTTPCMTVKCSAGYTCKEVTLQCLIAPCPVVARCVKSSSD